VEIDLSILKRNELAIAIIVLCFAAVVGLGKVFTPDPVRVLSWQEWQVRKVTRQESSERRVLAADVNQLADILNAGASENPARVQIVGQSIQRDIDIGSAESLADERAALQAALDATWGWSIGNQSYNAAVAATLQAQEHIANGGN